jgi:hypothetical protein
MEKATKKAAKKAPAKKAAKKVATKAAPKKVAKKAVKTIAKKVAVKKTVAPKAPAKKAVAKKVEVKKGVAKEAPAKKAAPKTVVVATVDVGFGNMLYLRGDAPGLSWKKGVPMDCQSADSWNITMSGVKDAFEYKVLINDIHWALGENNLAKPGVANSTNSSF